MEGIIGGIVVVFGGLVVLVVAFFAIGMALED